MYINELEINNIPMQGLIKGPDVGMKNVKAHVTSQSNTTFLIDYRSKLNEIG